MDQNKVVLAILAGAAIIAVAIYLRPTEFDACMRAYEAEGSVRPQVAADFCSR